MLFESKKINPQKNHPEQIIIDFLQKKNFVQTLEIFQKEFLQQNSTKPPMKQLIQFFKEGNRTQFFTAWEQIKKEKNNKPLQENEKLELFFYIYFYIFPIHPSTSNKQSIKKEDLNALKNYLEEKGTELSKWPELIPFFALPYFQDPKLNDNFKILFEEKWVKNLKDQLKGYLKFIFDDELKNTELEIILTSIKEENDQTPNYFQAKQKTNKEDIFFYDKMKKVEEKLEEKELIIQRLQNESSSTMKDIHKKWANFAAKMVELAENYSLKIKNVTLNQNDENEIYQWDKQLSEYKSFLHSSIEELFLEESFNSFSNPSKIKSRSPLKVLDFEKINQILIEESNVNKICAILEALRWRLTKAKNSYQKREAIIQLTSQQMPNYKLFKILIEKKSKSINEYLIAFINAFVSEYLGRSYLIENSQLLKHLIFILKNEKKESFICKNSLGILQKLSLRKKPQEMLIQNDIIKWAVNLLANQKDSLSDYSLEYLTALLLNLSLRTIGKNKFEEIKYSVLNLLYEMMTHEINDVILYVIGTLFSLFSRNSIKKLAIEMNYISKLETLVQQEGELCTKYKYLLDCLTSETVEQNLSEINEEENDIDLIEEEQIGEEPNEIPNSINFEEKGEKILAHFFLEGEEAEKVNQKAIPNSLCDNGRNFESIQI